MARVNVTWTLVFLCGDKKPPSAALGGDSQERLVEQRDLSPVW
jgi:hypothetical protein